MDKKEKVAALIANERTRLTEEDKVWLEKLEDNQLDLLEPMPEPEPEPEPEQRPQVNQQEVTTKEQAIQVLRDELSDPDKFMNLLPKDQRSQMAFGQKLYEQHRGGLIRKITSNTDAYTEEELKAHDTEALEKLCRAIKPANYSGLNLGGEDNGGNGPQDILLPPGVQRQN